MTKYLYQEVKEYLLKLIKENRDQPNYQLPSENQLAMKFSTTRITAKKALEELQNEGYIYRVHGKGSFISPEASEKGELRSGDFVCMLLPNLESQFITKMVDGAQKTLQENGLRLIVVNEKDTDLQSGELIDRIMELGVKGIIVFPSSRSRYNRKLMLLALNRFPVIFVDRTLRDFDISSVTSDHIAIAQSAVQLLFDRGCKKVGFISRPPQDSTSVSRRITGYEKAHIDNGRTIFTGNQLYLTKGGSCNDEEILEFLEANKDMDGLLAYGASMGLAVYRAIMKAGIRVPEQMKVVFLDDEYADYCDLLPFAPTCIAQHSEEIGTRAAELIYKYIKTKKVTSDKIYVDFDIIERDSTREDG